MFLGPPPGHDQANHQLYLSFPPRHAMTPVFLYMTGEIVSRACSVLLSAE